MRGDFDCHHERGRPQRQRSGLEFAKALTWSFQLIRLRSELPRFLPDTSVDSPSCGECEVDIRLSRVDFSCCEIDIRLSF